MRPGKMRGPAAARGGGRTDRFTPLPKEAVQLYADLWVRLQGALDALEWCGGSGDFAPRGKARRGWVRGVLPVLVREGRALPLQKRHH